MYVKWKKCAGMRFFMQSMKDDQEKFLALPGIEGIVEGFWSAYFG